MTSGVARLNLFDVRTLEFEAPDPRRFPSLRLAREALRAGGTAATVLNAANEIAVAAFLEYQIRFPHIAEVVEDALQGVPQHPVTDLDTVLAADRAARVHATATVTKFAAKFATC